MLMLMREWHPPRAVGLFKGKLAPAIWRPRKACASWRHMLRCWAGLPCRSYVTEEVFG